MHGSTNETTNTQAAPAPETHRDGTRQLATEVRKLPVADQPNPLAAALGTATAPRGGACHDRLLALPGLPAPMTLFGLLGAWHRRGTQVGFPELSDRPSLTANSRNLPQSPAVR